MKVLVVVSYTLTGKTPVDRRIDFFETSYGKENVSVLCLDKFFQSKRGVKNRLKRLISFNKRFFTKSQIEHIGEALERLQYDKLILTVPDPELLEIIKYIDIDLTKLHIDIRDGISFENLYSSVENIVFKSYLKDLEGLIVDANVITTNVPALKNFYEDKYNCDVKTAIPKYVNKLSLPVKPKRIIFAGGLMRSSIGLNALRFSISVRSLPDISVTFVGRFYRVEKFLYSAMSNGRIKFISELPMEKLVPLLLNHDCGLVFANCERAVMPSKINVYSSVGLPFLWIGNENVNSKFLEGQIVFKRVQDNIGAIRKALLE